MFFFKKLYKLKLNYLIYDKGLIIIIKAFKEQKYYLIGIRYKIKVYIDYKNLISFTIIKDFNK